MEKDLILDYQSGYTFSQLQSKYKISKQKIKAILTENNIHIRIGREKVIPVQTKEEIVKKYQNKSGYAALAREYGYDPTTIKKIVQEYGIPFIQSRKKNFHFKEDFFQTIDSEEKAYLLGLLTTDGYVKKHTIGIFLQEQDLSLIEKIREILGLDCEIMFDKRINKECCGIEVNSKKMTEDLSSYGVVPRKTYFLMQLSSLVPQHLYHHYLRGLYDGDGICSFDEAYLRIGFCGYNKEFVEDFQLKIDNFLNKDNHNAIQKYNAYQTSWKKPSDVKTILNWFYSDATIYLDRKYQKYLKYKELKN